MMEDNIRDGLRKRLAFSSFCPVKKALGEEPREELLLVKSQRSPKPIGALSLNQFRISNVYSCGSVFFKLLL